MRLLNEFGSRLLGLLRRERPEVDLERELLFHLEMEAEEQRRRGLSPEEALRVARIRLGGVEQVRENYRDQRSIPFVEERLQDLKFAWRTLIKAPIFTISVILVGALGIGANTAIFSIVNQTLLKPLPYPNPEQLGIVVWDYRGGTLAGHNGRMFRHLRDNFQGGQLAALAGSSGANLIVGTEGRLVQTSLVSADYFRVLGVDPWLGRGFIASEDRAGGNAAIVISHDLWRDSFDSDPAVLGAELHLGAESYTLIGVMPEDFQTIPKVDAWMPLYPDSNPQGAGYNYQILTRLETAWEAAQDQLAAISGQVGQEISDNNGFRRFRVEPYRTQFTENQKPALVLISGAVGLVLLLAIANISCLLLARARSRQAEIATRIALGGGRARIVRQILTECFLMALLAGAAGLGLSQLLVKVIPNLWPYDLGFSADLSLSLPVLSFAFAIAMVTGLIFGLAPAWLASSEDAAAIIQRSGSRGSTASGAFFRNLLVVCEVAICVVLLVLAGLLLRTFVNIRSVDPGFNPDHILTAQMPLQDSQREAAEKISGFYQTALQRIRSQPGVRYAAVSNNLPILGGLNLPLVLSLEEGRQTRSVDWRYVSSEYFQALEIPLRAGRLLQQTDTRSSLPVMVVNEAFQSQFFRDRNVLEQTVGVYPITPEIAEPDRTIVGVVGNVKGHGLDTDSMPTVYVPVDQVTAPVMSLVHSYFPVHWVIKLDEEAPFDPVVLRTEVRAVDPRRPFAGFRTMNEVIEGSIDSNRNQLVVLGSFALLALVMAMSGVYGLMAFQVTQGAREMGIRVAVGATPGHLLFGQLRKGLHLTVWGLMAGCGVSLIASRVVGSFLFGVSTLDPWTFLWVSLLVLLVSSLATLVPAIRATRLDPVQVLSR